MSSSINASRETQRGRIAVLRAKIDMSSGNINMRDPVMYRILDAAHPRTGAKWKIYPMYDFAHGQSDAIEGITHSICTLEYEDHRPLYDWYLDSIEISIRNRSNSRGWNSAILYLASAS